MRTRHKQEHSHDPSQSALFGQERAAVRSTDPETSKAAAHNVKGIRASHRRVMQLFRRYGPQTDSEAFEAAMADGWKISPSGLRSRRAELCPPRGAGIRDSGKKRKTPMGFDSFVWELDPTVEQPEARHTNPGKDAPPFEERRKGPRSLP